MLEVRVTEEKICKRHRNKHEEHNDERPIAIGLNLVGIQVLIEGLEIYRNKQHRDHKKAQRKIHCHVPKDQVYHNGKSPSSSRRLT